MVVFVGWMNYWPKSPQMYMRRRNYLSQCDHMKEALKGESNMRRIKGSRSSGSRESFKHQLTTLTHNTLLVVVVIVRTVQT